MKRKRSQSKHNRSSNVSKRASKSVKQPKAKAEKECKSSSKEQNSLSGRISKKRKSVWHITKAKAKNIVSSLKTVESRSAERATQMNLLNFPNEILLKFQSYLTYHSKCQCVLTCRRLNQVYSDPTLWADMPVNRRKIKKSIWELKTMSRFSKIKHINLKYRFLTVKQLINVLQYACWRSQNGNSLENLDLTNNNMGKVSPKLLKDAISCVEDVNLKGTKLTTNQINAVFSLIPSENALKKIDLSRNKLEKASLESLELLMENMDEVDNPNTLIKITFKKPNSQNYLNMTVSAPQVDHFPSPLWQKIVDKAIEKRRAILEVDLESAKAELESLQNELLVLRKGVEENKLRLAEYSDDESEDSEDKTSDEEAEEYEEDEEDLMDELESLLDDDMEEVESQDCHQDDAE